jgi:flagellar hook-basal body complex protein FliE
MEISKIGGLSSLLKSSAASSASGGSASFGDLVKGMVNQTVQAQQKAENLTVAAASGDNVPLHEIVQAISQAELTLQTMVTVRDRAVEAYQEIIRMPI